MDNHQYENDAFRHINRQLAAMAARIKQLESRKVVSVPIYRAVADSFEGLTDFDGPAVNGQIVLDPDADGSGGGGITGLKIVYGAVYNDADIIEAGSGDWTATVSSNEFTITFDPVFSSNPIVLLTANNNNPADTSGIGFNHPYFVELKDGERATNQIVVETYALDGTATDGGFDFLCIGAA